MRSLKNLSLVAAALMASTAMVQAADIIPEPPLEPLPPEVVPTPIAGGWYIRGDIGYSKLKSEGVTYFQGAALSGSFEQAEYDSTWSLQGGIGYQITDYLRADATLAYYGSAGFDGSSATRAACNGFADTCDFNDDSELESATILLANAYVDLGTVSGFTAYVGAGIGGAHVSYGDLLNDQTCDGGGACDDNDFIHSGEDGWRFAWALHAGGSYAVNCRTTVDAGYTFTRIEGGRMFGSGVPVGGGAAAGGYGFDGGIDIHTGRVGLRYALSDAACQAPVYEQPEIVYK
ncbi:MAG: porin family protein [Rhizobiaceae bacterium]|nr:porin family protein [Rhizobiaceae bacterium]